MGIFDGILICTDLDGTLLKNDKSISKENLEAIEYFKQNGGIFTFITGRMPYYVNVYEVVKPNAPFGCINGGGLYDYINNKYIWKTAMPDEIFELVGYIDKEVPDAGIQVVTFEKTYFCKDNYSNEKFRRLTGLENLACHYSEVNVPVAKIIFASEDGDVILKVQDALLNHPLAEKFDFVRSSRTLFEILPKGIGKGTSIEKLCEYLNIDKNKTIAIGDYNNDISMFCSAKVGIAVSNACKEALDAADFVTVSNEEDAIKAVIYDIEKGKYFNISEN